jgi:hypothetical protein
MNPIGLSQNQVNALPTLDRVRYENIFKVYKVIKDSDNSYYFYNILNKVIIPDSINDNILSTISINRNTAWTTLSYNLYGTISLWWLIHLINKPKDIFLARSGQTYKYIKPEYINDIILNIEQQINA